MTGGKAIRIALAICPLLTSVCFATPAAAGSLQVDPIKLEITSERKIASVRVRNEGDRPVTVRNHALSWTQHDGEDAYQEVAGIVVSPPIATIQPGAVQLVRVGLGSASDAPASYRLIIEEVPEANPGSGVQVALRLNLPLFVQQQPGLLTDLSWAAWRRADGKWVLEAVNGGKGYVRVESADAARETGLRFDSPASLGTVLPGSSRRWLLGSGPSVIDRSRFERIARNSRHDSTQTASRR